MSDNDTDSNEPQAMNIRRVDWKTGETISVTHIPADDPLAVNLHKARQRWAELKEAGTPYWCIHDGRGVDHEQAYWQNDNPDEPIHRKHGVRCRECGGYIQEG
jgi:hypothetical protein